VLRFISFVVVASAIVTACSSGFEASPTTNVRETSNSVDSAPNMVEAVSSAVVRLEVTACEGVFVGAGFLIDDRHIVTVAHNLAGADSVIAELGDEAAMPQLVGIDQARDVALLRTDIPMGSSYLNLEGGDSSVGDDLLVFGFPLGLDLAVTSGIVSNADVALEEEPLLRSLQIDGRQIQGTVGAPW